MPAENDPNPSDQQRAARGEEIFAADLVDEDEPTAAEDLSHAAEKVVCMAV